MIKLENASGSSFSISDINIFLENGEIRDLETYNRETLRRSEILLEGIGSGSLKLIKNDIPDPVVYYTIPEAIRLIAGYAPSVLDVNIPSLTKPNENTLYTHNTYRPIISGKSFLTTWAGADDDLATNNTGGGTSFTIINEVDVPSKCHNVTFTDALGDVYIHNAYVGYQDAGIGDSISASVYAKATVMVNTAGPYNITNNQVTYVGGTNGAYTLGGTPRLIPAFGTGAWNYDGTSLTPNLSNTGSYDIYNIDKEVYRILNNFQVCGSTNTPLSILAYDTNLIRSGLYIKISTNNVSNTAWKVWFNISLFRERTL